jgi:hypothetical protein
MLRQRLKRSVIATAGTLSCTLIAAGVVHAQAIDPAAEVLRRLKATSANTTSDGYQLKGVKLKGDIATDGIKFRLPSVVPEQPLVLMQQRMANCNTLDATLNAEVNKQTTNSETFSKSTTLGGETSVTVSYESPIGVGGSGTQSFNYSKTSTEETAKSETVGWVSGTNVPVGAKQSVTVQFVVSQQKLDNIPWSTNAIVGGAVDLNYEKSPGQTTVCLHENSGYGGKKKCYTTTSTTQIANFKNEKWDSGKGNLNDEVTGLSITGNAKVTLYQHTNYGGTAYEYTSSTSNVGKGANDKFSSIKIEPLGASKTITGNLNALLSDDQRRIPLSGSYKGVNGVQGDFRASAPTALTDSDCGVVPRNNAAASASIGSSAAAMRSAPSSVATSDAALQNATPIVGRVLKAGVKPTTVAKR